MTEKSGGGRLHHLDGMRGLAALCVVIGHSRLWPNHLAHFGPFAVTGVWVDFFFALSGFVIAYNYQQRLATGFGVGPYMWKRFARLWPAHAAMLVLLLGYEFLKLATQSKVGFVANDAAFVGDTPGAWLATLALVQALGFYPSPPWNAPAWSISTEIWTYLLFGLVFAFFKLNRAAIAVASALLIAISYVAILVNPGNHYLAVEVGVAFFRCVAGFGMGVLAYNALAAWGSREARPVDQAGQIALFLAGVGIASWQIGDSPVTLALPFLFGGLVYLLATRRGGVLERLLMWRPIQFLGTISYSLYISHTVLRKFVATADKLLVPKLEHYIDPVVVGDLLTVAYVVVAIVFGWLVWRYIEVPANDWLVKRLPSGHGWRRREEPDAAF